MLLELSSRRGRLASRWFAFLEIYARAESKTSATTTEKSGFKTTTIPSFDLLVGKDANESVVLSVGEANETVQVTSLAPQLQTSDAAVGQVIDQKQISDLPLNGRSVLQLATLAAGVSPAQFANT